MTRSSDAIARIKLAELERQHQRLLEHYDALQGRLEGVEAASERLELLYDGLRQARFAQRALHPEVSSLDALLLTTRAGVADEALVKLWVERLEREVEYGRRRTSFAQLFGALLDEWSRADAAQGAAQPPGAEVFAREYVAASTEAGGAPRMEGLGRFFERHQETLEPLRQSLRRFMEEGLRTRVEPDELRAHLRQLATNPHGEGQLREAAREVLAEDLQVRDLAGAVTILLNQDPARWRWPQEGARLRLVWKRDRWRPYLDTDLLTTLFLQVIGVRLGIFLKGALESHAPFSMTGRDEGGLEQALAWSRRTRRRALFLPSLPESLHAFGQAGRDEATHYEGFRFTDEEPDAMQRLLILMQAELRLTLDRRPGEAVFVGYTDLRHFFRSIPHGLVRELFGRLGVPPRWLELLTRFMKAPTVHEGERFEVTRGIALNHALSYLIAETLLRVLDAELYERTGVVTLRFMDDIYFIAEGSEQAEAVWEEIEGFCADCGLSLNDEKSGAVAFNHPRLSTLPMQPLRWGFLRLEGDGRWRVDGEALAAYRGHLDEALERCPSVLAKVAEYNSYMTYLIRGLGVFAALPGEGGAPHLREVTRALARLHGGQAGVAGQLVETINARFPGGRVSEARLPRAVLHWPVTAGGLGLCDPLVVLAGFHAQRETLSTPQAPPRPRDGAWMPRDVSAWLAHFGALLSEVSPMQPAWTPTMTGLKDEFVSRGSELLDRPQHGLTVYWQWVIHTYGPQLLERFGTFSFLINELVPMQLIARSRRITASLDEEMGSGAPRPGRATLDDVPF